jgi:hypothetical protein
MFKQMPRQPEYHWKLKHSSRLRLDSYGNLGVGKNIFDTA